MNEHPSTDLPAIRLGETTLSLRDLLLREHQDGRLVPWLRQRAIDAFLLDQARALGLKVEEAEKQRALDLFRRRRGLESAEKTHKWLAARRLTHAALEAALERDLLAARLRRHVTVAQVAERFQADPSAYDRLRLRLVRTTGEDQAREFLTQLQEEGADFADLARKHSRHPSRRRGGIVGLRFRGSLPAPVREAVAKAVPPTVVGPFAQTQGFDLLQLEEVVPATLNRATIGFIERRVFGAWLRERLAGATFQALLLDTLA